MDIVIPIQYEELGFPSSNLDTIEFNDWASQASWDEGDQVTYGMYVYKSVIDSNTDDPETGVNLTTPTWVLMGYSNYYRMYTKGLDSVSTSDVGVPIVITASYAEFLSTVALLNVTGLEGNVTMVDENSVEVYNEDFTIVDIGVEDEWEFFFAPYSIEPDHIFQDLPPYLNAEITITLTPSTGGTASMGRLLFGTSYDVGVTDYGTNVGRKRYRTTERDGFGNLTITPLRYVRKSTAQVTLPVSRVDNVQAYYDSVQDIPTLFIGVTGVEGLTSSTNIFGIAKDFDLTIDDFSTASYSVELEGY